ncbi:MAG: hypothetical protein RRA94_12645 [Bacteroidota bacterium]|nr:hypothetical protein [Bacteroidota bacterium]
MDKILTTILLGLIATTVLTTFDIFGENPVREIDAFLNSSEIQARELAVSGVEYAMARLEEDGSWASAEVPTRLDLPGIDLYAAPTRYHDPCAIDETLENARFVTSRALVDNEEVTVQAIIDRPRDGALPNALRYALYTGRRLFVDDQILVQDHASLLRNTNIHTNGYLGVSRSGVVQGFGTYSAGISAENGSVATVFIPNRNEGGSGVYRHPSIEMPALDPMHWQRIATRTYASSTTLRGDVNLGSGEEPGIWLIRGHCNLRANVRGNGVLLVEGDLRLYGKEARHLLREDSEHLLIVVRGNVFAEDAKINANIVCGGGFFGSGNVIIVGSLVSHEDVQNIGAMDIYYRPIPGQLGGRIWKTGAQPPRIAMFYE